MASQTNLNVVPDAVARIAETHQFGPFAQSLATGRTALTTVLFVLFLAASTVPCSIFWNFLQKGMLTGGLGAVLIGISLLIVLVGSLVQGVFGRQNILFIFEQGAVYRQGGQLIPLAWSQVANCDLTRDLKRYRVTMQDGRTYLIGSLAGYSTFRDHLKSAHM